MSSCPPAAAQPTLVPRQHRSPAEGRVVEAHAPTRHLAGWRARSAHTPSPRLTSLLPGLAVVAAAVAAAVVLSRLLPTLGALTWALVLGVVVANVGLLTPTAEPGTRWATQRLLRLGVVLLGLQLAVPQILALGPALLGFVALCVVVTFFGTRWMGRRMGLPEGTSLMVATGFSICGAAAIAAMDGVSETDEQDVATGIALVTICGTAAVFALPWLAGLLSLRPEQYGIWAGASVHEVAQVVAAAAPVTGALAIAVVVKLTRVVLLAPMIALHGVLEGRRRASSDPADRTRPPLVPLFVLGFLAMVAVRSFVPLPLGLLDAAKLVQDAALAGALFGLGTGVRVRSLRRTGGRALALGASSWLLIGLLGLLGAMMLG